MDATDYDGRAPLHLAACQGELNVVKFLVEKCAVNVGVKDRCVSTFSSSSLFSFFFCGGLLQNVFLIVVSCSHFIMYLFINIFFY